MNVLVTGANGFIGANLVKCLAENGDSVTAFIFQGTSYENISDYICSMITGDVTSLDDCKISTRNIDVVYHLAAIASDYLTLDTALKVNYGGTKNMLDASIASGVKRFVLISSLAVHHFKGHSNADENTVRDGYLTPYAFSKIKSEDVLFDSANSNEIEGVAIRPGLFPFGPGDYTSFFKLAKALEKRLFAFVNGGSALLCTSYVENLCEGIMLAGRAKKANGEVLNINDDKAISWKELINLFCAELGVKPPLFSIPMKAVLPAAFLMEEVYYKLGIKTPPPITPYRIMLTAKDFNFSCDKAKSILNYKPKVEIKDGVEKTVQWYNSVK